VLRDAILSCRRWFLVRFRVSYAHSLSREKSDRLPQ
jgi:hypothetical protein